MSSVDPLLAELVLLVADDWTDAASVLGLVIEETGREPDPVERALRLIEDGLRSGLLVAGDLAPTGAVPPLAFVPWAADAADASDRIRASWLALSTRSPALGALVWFDLTEKGERVAEELETRTQND